MKSDVRDIILKHKYSSQFLKIKSDMKTYEI